MIHLVLQKLQGSARHEWTREIQELAKRRARQRYASERDSTAAHQALREAEVREKRRTARVNDRKTRLRKIERDI